MLQNWNQSATDTTSSSDPENSVSKSSSNFEIIPVLNLNNSIYSQENVNCGMSEGDLHMLGHSPEPLDNSPEPLDKSNRSIIELSPQRCPSPDTSTPRHSSKQTIPNNYSRDESLSSNVSINPELVTVRNNLVSLISGDPQKRSFVTAKEFFECNDNDARATALDDTDLEILQEIPVQTPSQVFAKKSEPTLVAHEPSFFIDLPSSSDQSTPNPRSEVPRKGKKLNGPKSRLMQAKLKNQIKEELLQSKFGPEQLRYMSSREINDLQDLNQLQKQPNSSLQGTLNTIDNADEEGNKSSKDSVNQFLDLIEIFSPKKKNEVEATTDMYLSEYAEKVNAVLPDTLGKNDQDYSDENEIIVIIDDDQTNPDNR